MTDKEWPAKIIRQMYEERLSELPYNGTFDLIEELPSGKLLNHLRGVNLDHLKQYVRMVFVDVAPPKFIFREVSSERPSPPIEDQMFFDTDDEEEEEVVQPTNIFTFIKRLFQWTIAYY